MNYDDRMNILVKLIKKKVDMIARRTKVPHSTIWSDLNVLLSDNEAYNKVIEDSHG